MLLTVSAVACQGASLPDASVGSKAVDAPTALLDAPDALPPGIDATPPFVWYYTCGEKEGSCSGHLETPGIDYCNPEQVAGHPCKGQEGTICDPGSDCNELQGCANKDPQKGECP